MPSSIDNRVVVLSFDNKDFERNVQTSMGTLDKLKKGLDFDGASKGISALAASAKTFDLSPMGNAIEGIRDRFSTLGIIGMTVIQNLTNKATDFATRVFGQVVSGGIKRALNFEQAEFQLEGLLGKVEGGKKKIDEIMAAANNAVTGTAYGLDEAAKVASQLVASGIQDGEKMEFILKGIAGTAAMTGSSYTEMGDIFTTVAGNGRLMTEQLRQFSHRGLNVAATLAEQLGVTEQEIREMVTAGAIDFETFSTAMADAFGEHAQAANKTFTGSLSNVKAALSRLGAKVAMPALDHLRDIFNVLGPMIDAVSAALDPLINLLKNGMEGAARIGVKALTTLYMALGGDVDKLRKKTEYMSDDAKNAMNTAINHYERVAEIFNNLREAFKRFGKAIGGAFKETFQGLFSVDIKGAIEGLKNFSEKLILSDTAMEGLKRVIKVILAPLRLFIQLIEKIAPVVGKIAGFIGNAILKFLEFVGAAEKVSLSAENLERKTRFLDAFSKIIHNVGEAFKNFGARLKATWEIIKNSRGVQHLISEVKELWAVIKDFVGDKVDKFLDFLEKISGKEIGQGQGAFASLAYIISSLADKLAHFIEIIRTGENPVAAFFDAIKKGLGGDGSEEGASTFTQGLLTALKEAIKGLSFYEIFKTIKEKIQEALRQNVDEAMLDTNFLENIKENFTNFFDKLKELLSKIDWGLILKNIVKIVDLILKFKVLWGAGGLMSSVSGLINAFKNQVFGNGFTRVVNQFKNLAIAIGILAASLFVIAAIPSDRLKTSLAVLGLIMAAFVAIALLFSNDKIGLDSNKLKKLGIDMLMVSGAILVLSLAMKSIAKMSVQDIAKAEIAIAGLMAIFTLAARFSGDAKKGSASFAVMALAVDLLIPAMLVFGNMKAEKLIKGGAAVLALLTSLALASKICEKAVGGAFSMLLMAASIDALIPAILVFGNMQTEKLVKGGIAIEAFMFSMVAATKLAQSAVGGAVSMILMAASIDALIPAVLVFGNMDTDKLIQGGVAVVALLVSLAAASRIAQGSVKGAAAMLLMTVPLLAVGAALALLSNFTWDGILAASIALSAVMLALAGAARLAPTNLTGMTTMLAMTVPLLGAAAALAIVARYDWQSILAAGASISGVILAMTGAMLLLQAVPITGALMAIADLGIFIGGLAGIMVALGALSEYTSFGELIQEGAGVLGQLGRGLGDFAGGIIEGIGEGIANTLPKIAEGLSIFSVKVRPFLESMSKVDSRIIDGVSSLAKAMLIMCGTELLDALTSGFGLFDSSAVRFGQSLAEFAPYLVQFSDEVSGINEEKVQAAARAALMLSSFAKNIPNEGGLISKITGDNSLAQFAEELVPFGEALSQFSEAVTGKIDEESIAASTRCATLITEFSKTIPNEGGILAELIGDNTLAQFAEGLVPFGEAISQYSDSVTGKIDENSVAASTRSAQLIADFAKTIPNEGGFLADFVGDNTLAQFAQELVPFGQAIAQYSSTVSGQVDEAAVGASARSAQMIADFANTIPNEGGLVAKITGDNDLATFGAGLQAFGPSLAQYAKDIADVDADKVQSSANAAKMIADFAYTVPKSGGLVQLVTGDNDLTQFGEQLKVFGPALAAYSSSIVDISEDAVTKSVNAATIIAEFYDKTLPTKGGLEGLFDGNPLIHFGEELEGFGPHIAAYSTSVSEAIDQASIKASAGAAEMLATMYEKVTAAGISGGIEGFLKGNPLKKFGQELSLFAPYFVEYGSQISGLSTNKMIDVANVMPTIIEMVAAANSATYDKIKDFGDNLVYFGQKLLQYNMTVRSIDHGKISQAIRSVYSLIDMGKAMAAVNTTAMADFGNALKNVGVRGYQDFVAGIEGGTANAQTAVTNFINSVTSEAEKSTTNFGNALKNVGARGCKEFVGGIEGGSEKARTAAVNLINSAASGASESNMDWTNAGINAVNGMINGMSASAWALYQTAYNIAASAASAARSALRIFSPSRVMYQIGEYTVEGMAIGMADNMSDITKQGQRAGEVVLEAVAKPIQEIQNALESNIELDPVITPVLDLSNVDAGAGRINSMLGGQISLGNVATIRRLASLNTVSSVNTDNSDVVDAIYSLKDDMGNVTFNVTVDGSENPEDFADRLVKAMKTKSRM